MSDDDRTIRSLITESHQTALDHGWWDTEGERNLYEQIALMHSELSEALEELRKGYSPSMTYYDHDRVVTEPDGTQLPKPEGMLSEFADLFIRVSDTIGSYGLASEFEAVLTEKLRYNRSRPFRHGNKQA